MQLSIRMMSFRMFLAKLLGRQRGLYYIHGPEVLPQPLSREEEAEAIATLEAGGDGAEEARTRLIERNLRLVAFIARRYENPPTQGGEHLPLGQEHQAGHLRLAVY